MLGKKEFLSTKKISYLFIQILLFIFSVIFLGGCSPTLQQAKKKENEQRWEEAIEDYREIAKDLNKKEAFEAQLSLMRLLGKLKRWRELLADAPRLPSFLDENDEWYRRHLAALNGRVALKKRAKNVLLEVAELGYQDGLKRGNSMGYAVGSYLYGLVVELFPKAPEIAEASLKRGIALSIREGCPRAMKWFERSLKLTEKSSRREPIRVETLVALINCRRKLWIDAQKTKKSSNTSSSSSHFQRILDHARELLSLDPQRASVTLFNTAEHFDKNHFFKKALILLIMVLKQRKSSAIHPLARKKILYLFGKTKRWAPLLSYLNASLKEKPAQFTDRFIKRIKILVVIDGMRKVQALLKQRRIEEALQLFKEIRRVHPEHAALIKTQYHLALANEDGKKWLIAAELYRALHRHHPKHRLAPMALYRYALLLRKRKKFLKAAKWFAYLAHHYRKEMIASRALYEAYFLFRQQHRLRQARRMKRLLFRRYPSSMEAARLRQRKR